LFSSDDLHERHFLHGIEKVHAHDLAGRADAVASSVMESDEVFDAKIALLFAACSNSRSTSFLTSMFSTTASTARSTPAKPLRSVVPVIRSMPSLAWSVSRMPFRNVF